MLRSQSLHLFISRKALNPSSTERLTPHPEVPSEGVEGQRLQQHRARSAEADGACPCCCCSVAGEPLGKCQFVVDSSLLTVGIPSHCTLMLISGYSTVVKGREQHTFSVKDQVSNFSALQSIWSQSPPLNSGCGVKVDICNT